jgi:(p)ppGpp synthase/HD superfamily hydrolase
MCCTTRDLARAFAIGAHAGQKYGDEEYAFHLNQVEDVLMELAPYDDLLYICAWLHDVIEDTKVTHEQIRREFGAEVANIVWAVTDETGKNRAERHVKTYPKIRANPKAVILKLADRIANVRRCVDTGNEKLLRMYRDEYPGFRDALRGPKNAAIPRNSEMWAELDRLMQAK